MNGKHRDEPTSAAERYGRHSEANARGLSALELLQRAIANGEAIRLAWGDDDSVVKEYEELPTAVLPAIRPNADPPNLFSWWPKRLAG